MTERKVWIATPCRDGRVHAMSMKASHELQILALTGRSRGTSFCVEISQGSPNVPRQRNLSVARAEASGCDGILFLDADIQFNPEEALDIFERPEDVIGISHVTRPQFFGDPLNMSGCFIDPELPKRPIFDDTKDLIQAYRATTGFLYVKMSVFKKIRDAGLVKQYKSKALSDEEAEFLYDYFTYQVNDSFYEAAATPQLDGEDWEFAVKLRAAGVQMWLEPLAKLIHYEGSTGYALSLHEYWMNHAPDWRGDYMLWLQKRKERYRAEHPEAFEEQVRIAAE